MQGPLSTGLDFYRTVLDLRGQRQQILAADIANASTPGFKATDLDFSAALAAAGKNGFDLPGSTMPSSGSGATGVSMSGASANASPLMLRVDDPRQISSSATAQGLADGTIKYQSGNPVTMDGNSVDLDFEKRESAVNGVQYEATATLASNRVNFLLTAIRGTGAKS